MTTDLWDGDFVATAIDDEELVGPAGFWSYAHKDDKQVKGRIVRLADEIRDAYSLLTGVDLKIFVDREDLAWGHQWRSRIDAAVQDTTFFIPIITPRYFSSPECRRELLKFIGHAASIEALELLLPILFVDIDDLTENSGDEAKSHIARTQYADWRELRLSDESSENHQRAVAKLAGRLVEIGREYASRPTVIPNALDLLEGAAGGDTSEEPGLADLMAQMEAELPQWQEAMTALPPAIREVGELATAARDDLDVANASSKPFAQRVLVFRNLAANLQEPADRIAKTGKDYAAHLVGVDGGMRAFIEQVAQEGSAEDESIANLFSSVIEAAEVSHTLVAGLTNLNSSMKGPSKQSKDLRPVLSRISQGLQAVLDGQTVFDEWERLIREAGFKGDGLA
ncbi:toll/interleukin-1 receptor domain-containing protein [Promicromonospora sp. NPDC023805]|uniref:toll/interleukin-1 receptor domain-containing protein n=1 Tax=Promicromonospora sp. NPDC023805 TaxID=3154696 RepID=UPI0033F72FA8